MLSLAQLQLQFPLEMNLQIFNQTIILFRIFSKRMHFFLFRVRVYICSAGTIPPYFLRVFISLSKANLGNNKHFLR